MYLYISTWQLLQDSPGSESHDYPGRDTTCVVSFLCLSASSPVAESGSDKA